MGKKTEFLYLSEPDMIKAGVLDSARCIDVSEEVFGLLGQGDYIMGGPKHNEHGLGVSFPREALFPNMPVAGPDRRFVAMVAYLGGRFSVCGEKWYGSHIINPSRGLPRSVLMVMLNDPDTCEPLALMSANLISAMRTGAVPGVGTRYLARGNAEVCAVIGCGPINKASFQAIQAEMKNIREIIAYDLFPDKAEAFVKWAGEEFHIKGKTAATLEDAVRAGDIVSIAASRLKPLEIKNEWVKKGSLVILTGPAKADDAFWLENTLVYDNAKMHEAYMEEARRMGDIQAAYNGWIGGPAYTLIDKRLLGPLEEAVSLGDVVTGTRPGRTGDDDTMIFITSGMVLFDIGWGYEIYQRAKAMGVGQNLLLWDEAHWM